MKKNLEKITNKIYEMYLNLLNQNNSIITLKSDLQKANTSIANIMIAIEKGIITDTTKSRLEELEKKKKELEEKILMEEARKTYELTKEDISNYFLHTMKQYPNRAIELLVKFVKVYENKIEISLNCLLQSNEEYKQSLTKLFTETLTTTRNFKGGVSKTFTKNYDIYLVI